MRTTKFHNPLGHFQFLIATCLLRGVEIFSGFYCGVIVKFGELGFRPRVSTLHLGSFMTLRK